MSDLVERLRAPIQGNIHDERKEAADEIERLRAALKRIADSGVVLNGQFSWIVDEAKAALKGADDER